MKIHVVESGDSLYTIAAQYGVSMTQLQADNQLPSPHNLTVGQTIVVRIPSNIYIVKEGDTLSLIAKEQNLTVRQLWRNNPGLNGSPYLTPGQTLVLTFQQEPMQEIHSIGYAYPSIDNTLYRSTLPFLSGVSPFTHSIDGTGNLETLDDDALVRMASSAGTAPLLHVSTLIADTGFSGALSRSVLTTPAARENLISQIVSQAIQGGYRGVDLDFEGVFQENAAQYAAFVGDLRRALSPYGLPVLVALAPKTSADQRGENYEGHDYALLGQSADWLLLMTYEWGYSYSPPMAVSPINGVRRVVEFAVSQIEPQKLLLGLPNYGYDWTLPHIQGQRAKSIGCQAATSLAIEKRVSIRYDESSKTPWFRYYDDYGVAHEVWFEDARSIAAKLQLVKQFGLGGVGYWNLDRPFPQTYTLLNGSYRIADGL